MRAMKYEYSYVALIFFSSFGVSVIALGRAVRISLRDSLEYLANENFSWPNRDRYCFKRKALTTCSNMIREYSFLSECAMSFV